MNRYFGLWLVWMAPLWGSGQAAGKAILWDRSSMVRVSEPKDDEDANYARMIELKDGRLICVYEGRAGVESVVSTDRGRSWGSAVLAAANVPGVNMAVPEIIQLQDGSLLLSYNPRPRGGKDRFAICTKMSYDGGKTWTDERLLYQASDRFEDGCWEPAQIQLPSGEIWLFFSNEGIYTHSNEQNISIFRSLDNGLHWTDTPQIVSFTPGHRDGMPVPILLHGTDELLFSIEDNVRGQFKPSVLRHRIDTAWGPVIGPSPGDTNRTHILMGELPDTVYAGAPYLRQLRSGETILSYQSTLNRGPRWTDATMKVAVGDERGRDFINVADPFVGVGLEQHCLWNALCILKDDTIIAIASTTAFSPRSAIWMIKGKLQ